MVDDQDDNQQNGWGYTGNSVIDNSVPLVAARAVGKYLSDTPTKGDEIQPDPLGNAIIDTAATAGASPLINKLTSSIVSDSTSLPKNFSILTAENPGAQVLSKQQNAVLTNQLENQLKNNKIPFKKAIGSYGDTPENSIIIPHTKNFGEEEANKLGEQYGQEAVAHKIGDTNKLSFVTGEKKGTSYVGSGITQDPNLSNNYTQLGKNKFSLNLDFNKTQPDQLIHYSSNSQPLDVLDPSYMGSGNAGKETFRGSNIEPRLYYYEAGSRPEDVVTQNAKNVYAIKTPNKILDLASDQAKPIISKSSDLNDLESNIKNAGYEGYKNSAHPNLPNAVAIFTKQKPISSVPMDASQFQKLRRQGYDKGGKVRKNYAGGGDMSDDQDDNQQGTGYTGNSVIDNSLPLVAARAVGNYLSDAPAKGDEIQPDPLGNAIVDTAATAGASPLLSKASEGIVNGWDALGEEGALKLGKSQVINPNAKRLSKSASDTLEQIKNNNLSFFDPSDFDQTLVKKDSNGNSIGSLGLGTNYKGLNNITSSIKVDPDYRGQGVASSLYKDALDKNGLLRSSKSENQLEGGEGLWKKFQEENPYNVRQARNPDTLLPQDYKVWEKNVNIPLRKQEMALESKADDLYQQLDDVVSSKNLDYTNDPEWLAAKNQYNKAVKAQQDISDYMYKNPDDTSMQKLYANHTNIKKLAYDKMDDIEQGYNDPDRDSKIKDIKDKIAKVVQQHKAINARSGHTLYNKGGTVRKNYAGGGDITVPNQQVAEPAPPGLDDLVGGTGNSQASEPAPPGLDELTKNELKAQQDPLSGLQAGAEGLANSLTGGISGALEGNLYPGAKQDILNRREQHPLATSAGNIAGLTLGAVTGTGEAAALNKVGDVAASIIPGTNFLSKIGSSVVRGAVEAGTFQSLDENLKRVLDDPNYSMQSAIANVGGAALFGGVLSGALSVGGQGLKAIAGSQTTGTLKALASKLGGIESEGTTPISDALDTIGIQPSPEANAALSDNPSMQNMARGVMDSDSSTAKKFNTKVNDFKGQINDQILNSLGKTEKDIPDNISKYDRGKEIGNSLAKEYDAKISQPVELYNKLESKYMGIDLPQDTNTAVTDPNINPYLPAKTNIVSVPGTATKISDQLSQLAHTQGWSASPSSDIMREVNRAIKELPLQKTLSDLDNYSKAISDNTKSTLPFGQQTPLSRAGQMIRKVLEDEKSNLIEQKLGQDAPETLKMYQDAKTQYANVAQIRNQIDASLHARGSVAGYSKAVRAMASSDGEAVLNRLSGKGDASILQTLEQHFPETANLVKHYHIDSALEAAARKAGPDEAFHAPTLINNIKKLSPELQKFALPEGSFNKLNAADTLLSKLKDLSKGFDKNSSSLGNLLTKIPGSPLGIVTGLLSHNPALGIMTALGKGLGHEASDALRVGMLKFLASDIPVSGEGFNSMVEAMKNSIKGDAMLTKGAASVFKSASSALPSLKIDTDATRAKFQKTLDKLRDNPAPLFNDNNDHLGHYMPDHQVALGQTMGSVVGYLNAIRPGTVKASPLDTPEKPSSFAKSSYNKALDIANQPLSVLNKIKEGKLTPDDIKHLNAMYPNLYRQMKSQLQNEMVNHISKGNLVPYNTRMSLSLFMAQPLDSTMTPNAIVSAQPIPVAQMPQGGAPGTRAKHSMNSLNKLPQQYQTPSQSRQTDRQQKD